MTQGEQDAHSKLHLVGAAPALGVSRGMDTGRMCTGHVHMFKVIALDMCNAPGVRMGRDRTRACASGHMQQTALGARSPGTALGVCMGWDEPRKNTGQTTNCPGGVQGSG